MPLTVSFPSAAFLVVVFTVQNCLRFALTISAEFLFYMIRVCRVLRAAPNTFSPEKSHRKNAFLTVNAMDHHGPSCEKRSPENPQIFRASLITNNFSAKNSHSARGGYSKSKIKRLFLPTFEEPPSALGCGPSVPRPP